MKSAKSPHQGKGLPTSLDNSTASSTTTSNMTILSWNTTKLRLEQHRRSRHRYERDERKSWCDDWRVARCNQKTQKKVNQQTAMESDPKTSKHGTKKRNRWWDRSSTRYQKKKAFTQEAWQRIWRLKSKLDRGSLCLVFFFDLEHVAFFVSHYSGFLVFVLSFQKVGKLMCSCSIPQEIWGHPKDGVERFHEMNCSNPHFDCPIMASLVHCLICTSEFCLIICLNLIQSGVTSADTFLSSTVCTVQTNSRSGDSFQHRQRHFLCITFINLQMALKGDFPRWQKKRNGYLLWRQRFQKSSFSKCCASSSTTQKRCDSKYIQDNENSQKPKPEQ